MAKLKAHVEAESLSSENLLFGLHQPPEPMLPELPDPDTLGRTEPNAKGRTYKHGTKTAYTLGGCKCEHCRAAFAHCRAERRAAGKDNPRGKRVVNTDGHIPGDWWRNQVWHPALERAGLGNDIRFYDLRHSHASWLLAGGADLQVVKERMGHKSIRTTEIYLHTLPEADDTALARPWSSCTVRVTTCPYQGWHAGYSASESPRPWPRTSHTVGLTARSAPP